MAPLNNIGPVETAYRHDEITQAQLTLIGLPHELSDRDNQSSGPQGPQSSLWQNIQWLILRSLVTNVGWTVPFDDDDPRCCCNAKANEATIVVARVAAAAGPIEQVSYRHAKISHGDFEDFICFELRPSGSATFEHVHDCTFNFVYNPVGKALTKSN